MKIYRELVLDISTGEIIKEDSYDYQGPLDLCKGGGGGGGSTGKIEYDADVEARWREMIDDLVVHLGMDSNWQGGATAYPGLFWTNPFGRWDEPDDPASGEGLSPFKAFSPKPFFRKAEDALRDAMDDIVDMDFQTDWETMSAAALAEAEGSSFVLSTTQLADRVTAFTNRQTNTLLRSVNRLSAQVADINAVNNSQYLTAIALLEMEHNKEVADFSSGLEMDAVAKKMQFVEQGINIMSSNMIAGIQAKATGAQLRSELARIETIAYREEEMDQYEISRKAMLWGLEVWQHIGNLFASPSGGTMTPGRNEDRVNTGASALAGGISGAITGGIAGSAISQSAPVTGTLAGAMLGGASGYFSGS